jgi:hypothetical protein
MIHVWIATYVYKGRHVTSDLGLVLRWHAEVEKLSVIDTEGLIRIEERACNSPFRDVNIYAQKDVSRGVR